MNLYDLQPTDENIVTTIKEDLIDRNCDLLRFVSFINAVDTSCSIAIDAQWGAGKTFFVKQAKVILDSFNDFIDKDSDIKEVILDINSKCRILNNVEIDSVVSVYYDAWLNDNANDPLLSLVYSMLKEANGNFTFRQNDSVFSKTSKFLDVVSGRSVDSFLESIKGTNPLEEMEKQDDIQNLVSDFLESLLLERGNKLVVFIDELDRCRPDFAVRLLERIKHYFCNDRIIFVFSINASQLQHTIKRYYGEEFAASKYLDRFFDYTMPLPPANMQKYYNRLGLNNSSHVFEAICRHIIKHYNFEMREVARFYTTAKLVAYKPTHNCHYGFREENGTLFELFCLVPLIIALQIHDQSAYRAFINGSSGDPLYEVMADYNSDSFPLTSLLNKNETFVRNSKDDDRILVNLQDRLKSAYEAVFVHDYDKDYRECIIGEVSFDRESKGETLRFSSAFSNYSDINMVK